MDAFFASVELLEHPELRGFQLSWADGTLWLPLPASPTRG
jgi:hypothetical protein